MARRVAVTKSGFGVAVTILLVVLSMSLPVIAQLSTGTISGTVTDQTGAVTFSETDDAVAYGVTDEIARRVWLTGGRVLAVRRQDIPGEGPVAAILRYAL